MSLSPQEAFRADITACLQRLRDGKLRISIPTQHELHRTRPGFAFHHSSELFIQTGGATDFICSDQKFRLQTSHVCVMPRGVPHHETPVDLKTPYGILVFMRDKNGMFLHRAHSGEKRKITEGVTLHLPGVGGREAFRYLDDIADSTSIPAGHRRNFVRSLLEAFLLTALARLMAVNNTRALTGSLLINEAEKLISTSLGSHELSVQHLSKLLGCTPDHLSRQFHRERNVTLVHWITSERVSLAKEMLRDNRYNVAEIAWACGFKESSYFIRIFRLHVGTTPRAYRLQQFKGSSVCSI